MVLRSGEARATIAGGRFLEVTSLVVDGAELLVGAEELPVYATVHGSCAGITLLHPWANRLSVDVFSRAGAIARVGRVGVWRDPGGLALHGVAAGGDGWLVTGHGTTAQALLDHAGVPASPFPYAHEMRVALTLDESGLTVVTTLIAAPGAPVPIAFGWHPYLRPPGGAGRSVWSLRLPPRRRLVLDARGLPTADVVDEPAFDEALDGHSFDDCYDSLATGARLSVDSVCVDLLEGYPVAQVFAPPDVDVVSLEPMTAPVDALVSGRGLPVVAPGETFSAAFRVGLS